jgi:hypothetical protein
MKSLCLILLSIGLLTACTSTVDVLKPEGETVTLTLTSGRTYEGELLTVDATRLLFGYQGGLYAVALAEVRKVYVHGYRSFPVPLGEPKVHFSSPFNKKELKKLRLYCRYPQGLTSDQAQQLLQHYKQDDFRPLAL